MKVIEVIKKKVIYSTPNENIAKVLEKMKRHKIHQLPVLKNSKFFGMIFLKRLLKKGFFPEKSKAIRFVESVPLVDWKDSLESSVIKLLNSGVRALPVVKDSKIIGMISESDLIKYIELEEIPLEKIKKEVVTARIDDRIGKVRSLMENLNISRVPILDKDEKIVGCVGNLELARLAGIPPESQSFSGVAKEKVSLEDLPVKNFIRETCLIEKNKFSIKNIIKKFQKFEEVIITEKDKPISILTPKDVLRLMLPKISKKVEVSNMNKLERNEVSQLFEVLQDFVDKYEKPFKIVKLKVRVRVYSKEGKKKYSLRASLHTSKKVFFAKSHAWNIMDASQTLIEKFKKIIFSFKEKKIDRKIGKPKSHSEYLLI